MDGNFFYFSPWILTAVSFLTPVLKNIALWLQPHPLEIASKSFISSKNSCKKRNYSWANLDFSPFNSNELYSAQPYDYDPLFLQGLSSFHTNHRNRFPFRNPSPPSSSSSSFLWFWFCWEFRAFSSNQTTPFYSHGHFHGAPAPSLQPQRGFLFFFFWACFCFSCQFFVLCSLLLHMYFLYIYIISGSCSLRE